jgi:succinate-semialdehyde dehydrogenase/glutarate-semialdehyde dehydrogenase
MPTLISTNPANNNIVGEVNISLDTEIIEKVKKAHAAKKAWKLLGAQQRADMLRPLHSLIEKHQAQIAHLITQEMGKPITQAQSEVTWSLEYFQDFVNNGPQYLTNDVTVKEANALHQIVYEPLGVVACITPWNFPFSNFVVSVIPLLIAGNTVVFKHSEECPLVGKFAEDLMQQLNLPEGVFSEIYGDGKVGEILVAQHIDAISFTGSSRTGKMLYEIAAQKQIKAILEMGGSDPAVVFEDADIAQLIPNLIARRFDNCGQVCCAVKRLIVHEAIYDKVVARLVDSLRHMIVGDPENPQTQLGPLAAIRQLQLLEAQIGNSIDQGAVIAIGGKRVPETRAAFYQPTILTHIKRNMSVWTEEIFGPVLPVIAFQTESEAIELANETIYGLSGVVYSNDIARARRVASQIDAGCIDINFASHWRPCNPFGGFKASGIGCIYGKPGFQELCRIKVIAE